MIPEEHANVTFKSSNPGREREKYRWMGKRKEKKKNKTQNIFDTKEYSFIKAYRKVVDSNHRI